MARKTRKGNKGSKGVKKDHYQVITDRIVEALEKGTAPWVCPWDKGGISLPHNGHSKHVYSGLNTLMCWTAGFGDPRWYTFNQVKKHYGKSHVRKGECGTPVIKWLFLDKEVTEEDADGNEVTRTRRVPILRTYTVFNYEQVEWDEEKAPKPLVKTDNQIDPEAACAEAAALVQKSGAKITHKGTRAYYRPPTDSIGMPPAKTFKDAESYWATMLHEMTHWTGHEARCARDLRNRFGSEKYAAEELVAELGSAFLCNDLGIRGQLQHEEYIGNWAKVLKGDKYAIFTAARLAREAVTFLTDGKAKKGTKVADETATDDAAQAA